MRAYLHPDLRLAGKTLTDTCLDVRYTVTTETAWLLRQIKRESRVEQVLQSAARQHGISRTEARRAAYALFGYLDTVGGIYLKAPGIAGIHARLFWRQRYRPTVGGFCAAMVRAYGILVLGMTGLSGSIVWFTHAPPYWALLPAAILASCLLHEAGHVLAVRFAGVRCYLLARTGFAAVAYVRPSARKARVIAAAGPLVAAAPYVVALLMVPLLPIRLAMALTAAVHLLNLLPLFADGKTLWRTHEQ